MSLLSIGSWVNTKATDRSCRPGKRNATQIVSGSAAAIFGVVLTIAITTLLLSYLIILPSVAMLRRTQPDVVRPFRVPGGTVGLLSWTPEGMIGGLFRTMSPFAPPPPPGAQPPPLWGSEDHLRGLFGESVDFHTFERRQLEVTAFTLPTDYAQHFKDRYGPTIAARANAAKSGREGELDEALDAFCEEWNLGSAEDARFEMEYLLAVGSR